MGLTRINHDKKMHSFFTDFPSSIFMSRDVAKEKSVRPGWHERDARAIYITVAASYLLKLKPLYLALIHGAHHLFHIAHVDLLGFHIIHRQYRYPENLILGIARAHGV